MIPDSEDEDVTLDRFSDTMHPGCARRGSSRAQQSGLLLE